MLTGITAYIENGCLRETLHLKLMVIQTLKWKANIFILQTTKYFPQMSTFIGHIRRHSRD